MANNNLKNDGGYYAIKGFEFQMGKAILEVLDSDDENKEIAIEQIQDISSDDFIMQVKYKETQNFTPYAIREPIIQLISDFISADSQQKYRLYCYFKDKDDGIENIDLAYLKTILGKKVNSFTAEQITSFLSVFQLIFAKSFQDQFTSIISKIRGNLLALNEDEAIFCYANIAYFLRELIIENKNKKDRVCTKKQVFEYVKDGKKLIFNSSFKKYGGEKEYLRFIKSKFVKAKKNQENFIFLGDVVVDGSVSLGKLVLDIIGKYYEKAQHDIKPLTFIVFNKKAAERIKIDLINDKILFNDGYEHIQFDGDLFFKKPIVNKKTVGNTGKASDSLGDISFRLRILSKAKFLEIKNHNIRPQMIYYFDSEVLDVFNDVSFIKIDELNTKEIVDIFTER